MPSQSSLGELADLHGVATRYINGLDLEQVVSPDSVMAVLRALDVPIESPGQATELIRAHRADLASTLAPAVLLAWDGYISEWPITVPQNGAIELSFVFEDTSTHQQVVNTPGSTLSTATVLPLGYHTVTVSNGSDSVTSHVIAAPTQSWQTPGERGWGVYAHLPAVRTNRSRSIGDLADLDALSAWLAGHGAGLVSVLPLLPIFASEPSPYSPVSRLFWNELHLDLGQCHTPLQPTAETADLLQFDHAAAEVRSALRHLPWPDDTEVDSELERYARFRGTQAKHGRNWQQWPSGLRNGQLTVQDSDPCEEWFHRHCQTLLRTQLYDLSATMDRRGQALGLDLAVGVHPEGYDVWSRQHLFASNVTVGAPPDRAFPTGQNWGFAPVAPSASAAEGHQYLAASVRHQAAVTGVLRIDHVMAVARLFWIPEGADVADGTYVANSSAEQFAVLALESHRNRCALIGENLGTVPAVVNEGLATHGIWGSYVAQFSVGDSVVTPPASCDVAMADTHDTATFAGWMVGADIADRVQTGLLAANDASAEQSDRAATVATLSAFLLPDGASDTDPDAGELLDALLAWLAAGSSPWVLTAIENLWLERTAINLPGTSTKQRANWQRPWVHLLETLAEDPGVRSRIEALSRRLSE